MATKAYRIYSHYSTSDRERLEIETGQNPYQGHTGDVDYTAREEVQTFREEEDADIDDAWKNEKSTFGLSQRILRPPKFVPAKSTGVWLESTFTPPEAEDDNQVETAENIGNWYKSLVTQTAIPSTSSGTEVATSVVTTGAEIVEAETSGQLEQSRSNVEHKARLKARLRDPAWFISHSLPTTPPPSSSESVTQTLSRTLPPTPSQQGKDIEKVPVFLTIGPWNKGYQMLNKNWGWEEGDVLGMRRGSKVVSGAATTVDDDEKTVEPGGLSLDDVIDLTLSEEEEEEETIFLRSKFSQHDIKTSTAAEFTDAELEQLREGSMDDDESSTLALQTPLRATLKVDKLGIGYRAKGRHHHFFHHHLQQQRTFKGKPKSIVKANVVPDSRSEALKHGESLFRASFKGLPPLRRPDTAVSPSGVANVKKAAPGSNSGRSLPKGRRGFERAKKSEEIARKRMLAYLNN